MEARKDLDSQLFYYDIYRINSLYIWKQRLTFRWKCCRREGLRPWEWWARAARTTSCRESGAELHSLWTETVLLQHFTHSPTCKDNRPVRTYSCPELCRSESGAESQTDRSQLRPAEFSLSLKYSFNWLWTLVFRTRFRHKPSYNNAENGRGIQKSRKTCHDSEWNGPGCVVVDGDEVDEEGHATNHRG